MRASSSIASQAFIREIGADTITMPFSDVLPSLQTGLIDAGVTSVTMYALSGIPSEAPYYLLTRHTYDMGVLIANDRWFEGLQPRERDGRCAGPRRRGGDAPRRRAQLGGRADEALPTQGVTLYDPTPDRRGDLAPRRLAGAREADPPDRRPGASASTTQLLEGKAAWKSAQSAGLSGAADPSAAAAAAADAPAASVKAAGAASVAH